MKRKTLIGSLALMAIFGLSNCTKEEPKKKEVKGPTTVEEKIMANTWIETARVVDGNDAYSSLADCQKDDEYSFLENGVYRIAEGALVCDPSSPGPRLAEWTLKSDNVISILRADFNIDSITDDVFKITFTGASGVNSFTYKKKK